MKHIHLFQYTGGGCGFTKDEKDACDDSYECECGATFVAFSSPNVHFTMPQNIAGKEKPEPIEINTN